MPHSGGGGSHSGGGGGGSHSSGGSRSGGSTPSYRQSNTRFAGSRPYIVYEGATSKVVYSDDPKYKAEMTKKERNTVIIFSSIFILVPVFFLFVAFLLIHSLFSFGLHKTPIPSGVDETVYIYDVHDIIPESDERALKRELEEFRDETGVIPAVEFVYDEDWQNNFTSIDSWGYDAYVTKFSDESHVVITYAYGYVDAKTGFNEFHWSITWGDDLGKTVGTGDEVTFGDLLQREFTVANGSHVEKAIICSFDKFREILSETRYQGDDFGNDMMGIVMFILIPLFVIFAGIKSIVDTCKQYNACQEKDIVTYALKPDAEPEIATCDYCGVTYYKGTIGVCRSCGAPLVNK